MAQFDSVKIKKLNDAKKCLKIASMLIYEQASGTKPFRASKFLNILGKEIGQLAIELSILLGDTPLLNDTEEYDSPHQSSLLILKAMKEDGELRYE